MSVNDVCISMIEKEVDTAIEFWDFLEDVKADCNISFNDTKEVFDKYEQKETKCIS